MSLRILFLGENWYGSCARACCYALRRLGCDVTDIDVQTIIPQWRQRSNRGIVRLLRSRIIREYNQLILDAASHLHPDILLAFKGTAVTPATLRILRSMGITLYNYFPDTIPSEQGRFLSEAIHEYDCVFYTKKFWDTEPPDGLGKRPLVFLPHGYDPDVHRRLELDSRDISELTHDVTVVASHTAYKEQLLGELVRLMPNLDLHIYGDRWIDPPRAPELRRHIKGMAVTGSMYVKTLQAARINLAITSWTGRMEVDETTTRSFEIPACGGFMLHERTRELLELYDEDREIACFSSVEELASKIDYYLSHPEERYAIARAGHARCVPAYSYDSRMKEILSYYEKNATTQVKSAVA
jgi:glycosyltransferase involved in cell wall biosynthesis